MEESEVDNPGKVIPKVTPEKWGDTFKSDTEAMMKPESSSKSVQGNLVGSLIKTGNQNLKSGL